MIKLINIDCYILSYKLPPQNKMNETYLDFWKVKSADTYLQRTYLLKKQYFNISISNNIN